MAAPEPGPGEVRVRLAVSGINPGDTKKRADSVGYGMPFPRVVPHSDGSGVIEAVGDGVDPTRVGRRVWVYGAQSYGPFGTAAQYTTVPAERALELPDDVSDEIGARQDVLVHGVRGSVGSMAAPLARWGGATVIGTVRHRSDLDDDGALSVPTGEPLPVDQIAEAHDRVDAGTRQRVLLAIPQ